MFAYTVMHGKIKIMLMLLTVTYCSTQVCTKNSARKWHCQHTFYSRLDCEYERFDKINLSDGTSALYLSLHFAIIFIVQHDERNKID